VVRWVQKAVLNPVRSHLDLPTTPSGRKEHTRPPRSGEDRGGDGEVDACGVVSGRMSASQPCPAGIQPLHEHAAR